MGNDTATTVAAPHTSLTLAGELDVSGVHDLRRSYTAALDRLTSDLTATSTGDRPGVNLDLGGVTFMDAAGLGAVLWCRQQALSAGRGCTVDAASPVAARLMRLTGTHDLLLRPIAEPVPA